jgi:AcrR family transcriptional regulator
MSTTERFGQDFVTGRKGQKKASRKAREEGGNMVLHLKDTEVRADGAKRRQIIDGACRIFLAQGFDAASMGAIARAAGVSKGTLYVYFKSKEELFEAIVEEQCQWQAQQILAFDERADIEAELRRVGKDLMRLLCQRPGGISPLRTVIAIADRMPELGARFYQSGPARTIAVFRRYLETKVAQGILEPHDCEVAAAQLIDACVSLTFKPMLFGAAGAPTDSQIAYVVDVAVRAFLAAYRRR